LQQLHLVGFTADLEGLIFSAKKGARSGAFVVAMDESLFSALEEARKLVSAAAGADDELVAGRPKKLPALGRTGLSSTLSVREVQSRLRAGSSLAEVADAAGVDEGWVARFAAPVLAEQAAVVSRTLPLVFETTRKGPSSRPLGESVRWNLVDRGIAIDDTSFDAYWSAFQVTPRQWAVRFTYLSRGRPQVAEWEVDAETSHLTARNRLASDLAYVAPGARRRKPADPAEAAPAKRPARKRPAARAPAKRAPAKKAAPRKAATGGAKATSARKAAPAKKTAPRKAAAKKAVAKKPAPPRRAPSGRPPAPVTAPVLVIPSPRPGTRGVTAAQASAPRAASTTIGTPGRPNPSAVPYRPTIAARPAPVRSAPPRPEPVRPRPDPPQAVADRPRNVVPAVPVVRPVPMPTSAPVPRSSDSHTVRRLPAPSATAVALRDQGGPTSSAPAGPAAPPPPTSQDRPSILVIDAEQAGRRRPRQ
jgi:hypothetical protein